jgi:Protein of unknown function (DUF3223)
VSQPSRHALVEQGGRPLLEELRKVRDQYAQGVPLAGPDRRFVLAALRRHPRGKEKFGDGVTAVVVRTAGPARFFAVVHPDGTETDFSVYKAAGLRAPGNGKKPAAKPKPKPARGRARELAERDGAAVAAWCAQVVAETGSGPAWRQAGRRFGWGALCGPVIREIERAGWITTGSGPRSMRPAVPLDAGVFTPHVR